MTIGEDKIFIDTNVLIHVAVIRSELHDEAVRAIERCEEKGSAIWISRQIIREYLSYVTRPHPGVRPEPIQKVVRQIHEFRERFSIAEDNSEVTDQLLQLLCAVPSGGKQIHDANIVATMLTYSIPALLTYNRADFERYSPYITLLDPATGSAV